MYSCTPFYCRGLCQKMIVSAIQMCSSLVLNLWHISVESDRISYVNIGELCVISGPTGLKCILWSSSVVLLPVVRC